MTPSPANPFDALLPAAMAARAEEVGEKKARMAPASLFALAVLAASESRNPFLFAAHA